MPANQHLIGPTYTYMDRPTWHTEDGWVRRGTNPQFRLHVKQFANEESHSSSCGWCGAWMVYNRILNYLLDRYTEETLPVTAYFTFHGNESTFILVRRETHPDGAERVEFTINPFTGSTRALQEELSVALNALRAPAPTTAECPNTIRALAGDGSMAVIH